MLSLTSPSPTSLPPPPLPQLHPNLAAKPPTIHFSTPSELQQLHALLLKDSLPFPPHLLPRAASLCSLSSSSTFSYSLSLLRHYSPNPTFIWNSLLRSLPPSHSLSLFLRLHLSNSPFDTFSFCFVLKSISALNDLSTGRAIHAWIEKLGLRYDLFLLNALLHMYVTCGDMAVARLLFDRMPVRDAVTWNTMIIPMTKVGDMDYAREMFDRMPERSLRSWTAMIAGYVQCNNAKEAVELYLELERVPGMRPSEVTVVAVLAACADLGHLDLGRRVHDYTIRCGFEKNVRICNTLIDMYIKCGCVDIAREVFDGMPDQLRTVVSWSAMICGHAMHGQGEKALELFSRMTEQGFQPNGVTFVGLLHACSHMGLVPEGFEFFESMKRNYNIAPTIEHYGCVVDLLSRAGLLKEALKFIHNMPIKPNSVVWGAVLGGAKLHKNIEMGEEAMRHLIKLNPQNDGYYVVLSNIYAEAGRWEDVARIRQMMKEKGVKKTPGWSSISLDGVVHEFVAGECDHKKIKEIHEKWETLLVEMRHRGYAPDTSVVMLDMEEREKERVLFSHSEKLAVMFGLMSTKPGTTIRIMKNLRVCNDCHAAMKLISEISRREIVLRDRNRFHCFRDGVCSCKDYW